MQGYAQASDMHAVGDVLTCYLEEPPVVASTGVPPVADEAEAPADEAEEKSRMEAAMKEAVRRRCAHSSLVIAP
jgi:hypothetical protein